MIERALTALHAVALLIKVTTTLLDLFSRSWPFLILFLFVARRQRLHMPLLCLLYRRVLVDDATYDAARLLLTQFAQRRRRWRLDAFALRLDAWTQSTVHTRLD